MNYFVEPDRISFNYNGVSFSQIEKETVVFKKNQEYITEFLLPDGLKVTKVAHTYEKYGAYEWVTWFTNTSDKDSGIISHLNDADFKIPFDHDEIPSTRSWLPADDAAKIYNPVGSIWWPTNNKIRNRSEFFCDPETILAGETKHFATSGGRSSQEKAPFFDIYQRRKGVIFAIGWTGQWNCTIAREEDKLIHVQSGIEGVRFKLHPGEKIRTSSIVVMPYECEQNDAHNRFRRLIKDEFSLLGKEERDAQGPLANMFWGGMSSEKMIGVIHNIREHNFGYEYIWVEAGWYGNSTQPCPNEFEGDWPNHTGDWNVNPTYHPNGLKDVSKAALDSGMKFMMWLEPERCNEKSKMALTHPEWFLRRKGEVEGSDYWLLNLGDEKALDYVVELLSGFIEDLSLSCYRQDFNMDPLPYWNENDEPDREGILQIKHIMGLYTLWDTLLEKFPYLLIDNCASGGRRIDIETLRRSVPLWRSDYMCTVNCKPETNQTHTVNFSWWLPYAGAGVGGLMGDTYRTRSCYAPAMVCAYWGYEGRDFREEDVAWVERTNEEYRQVRPYLSCDFYPVVMSPMDDSNWAVSQYNRPENGDGVILAFRRPLSVCDRAQIQLKGLETDKTYVFYDADSDAPFEASGKELSEEALSVYLPEKRSSKLLFYQMKK